MVIEILYIFWLESIFMLTYKVNFEDPGRIELF
jgi:hypothetical protein